MSIARRVAGQVGGILVGLALWQVAVSLLDVPAWLVPSPLEVGIGILAHLDVLAPATAQTLSEAVAGFVGGNALGLAGALLMVRSRGARQNLLPVAITLRSVPLVAIAPVLTVLLGFGPITIVTMASLLTFFPAVVSGMAGLQSAGGSQLQLFQVLGASDQQVNRYLRWPLAIPYLFAAFKITAPASVLGAMIAEWTAANSGLGYLILDGADSFRFDVMWAAIVAATLLAVVGFALATILEHKVVWWPSLNLAN